MTQIIKNNLVVIAIHIVTCLALLYPVGFTFLGQVQYNVRPDFFSSRGFEIRLLLIGVITIVVLALYFLIGRKLLIDTNNQQANIFSVLPLAILIAATIFIAYNNLLDRLAVLGILVIPIIPISETASHFLRIESKYMYMIMSILPSLALWMGMTTKR